VECGKRIVSYFEFLHDAHEDLVMLQRENVLSCVNVGQSSKFYELFTRFRDTGVRKVAEVYQNDELTFDEKLPVPFTELLDEAYEKFPPSFGEMTILVATMKAIREGRREDSRWRFESDHRAAELEPDHGL